MAKADLSAQRLRELLNYDSLTGLFTWRVRASMVVKVGNSAGSTRRGGYIAIQIDGTIYLAHRLAWLYMTDAWPKGEVDHIDGNGTNNSWHNLRDGDKAQNMQNKRRPHSNNKSSKFLGVTFCPRRKKFRACIGLNGRRIRVGDFDTDAEAGAAYVEAKRRLHPGCAI